MAERSVLITGVSSGIGLATALEARKRGWRVLATARRPEDLERLQKAGLEPLYLDYADAGSIAAAAASVLEMTGGRLDALFNNGAFGQPGAVEDLTPDVLRAQFEVNVFGWHDLTCRIIPAMRAAGSGRIVQCSSVLGIAAMKYRGAYTASKFALEGLTDTLRLELRGTGIEVVTVRPGPIATRFVERSMEMFHAHIDVANSVHYDIYKKRLARMARGGASRFKLPASAVAEVVLRALESSNPRPYYAVTTPTVLMSWARRLLPDRAMVRFLARLSDQEVK